MSSLIPDLTKIPAPRTPLIDERTGLMSREWYRFFYNLYSLAGSGGNFVSLEDIQKAPPSVPFEAFQVDPNVPTNAPTDAPLVSQIDEIDKQINALESQPKRPCAEYNAETQKKIDGLELTPQPQLGTFAALQQDNLPWTTFDTTPQSVPTLTTGTLYWDSEDRSKTLALVMEDTGQIIQDIGEETFYRVKATATITKGQVLMFTGTVGASGGILAAPATGLLPTQSEYILGVATQDIALNSWGYATWFGEIKGVDTTGGAETWVDGQILYYNPAVAGGLTKNIPAAPNPKVIVAAVIHAASNGILFIRPTFGSALGETDSNVQISGLTNGDLLQYDGVQQRWENVPASTLPVGTATNLAGGLAGSVPYQTALGTTTFLNIGTALQVLKVNAGATAPEWVSGAALTKVDDTNVTLTLGGSASTALLNAASITAGWTGQLAVSRGGTGIASGTSGGIPYFSSTTTIASSAALASNALVVGGGAGVAPSTITTGTGVVTALGVNTGTAGAFVINGAALGTPSSGTVTNLTGTASININGTVGATTPNTGAFTTLSASGVATFSAGTVALPAITTTGDTNTGIYFPAADTIAFTEGGVEAMRIDASGNVGVGVAPSAWFASSKVVQAGPGASISSRSNTIVEVTSNAFLNTSGSWTYQNTGEATLYAGAGGLHRWSIAPSGTAGTAITFTQALTLNTSGNLGIGTASPVNKLQVVGSFGRGAPVTKTGNFTLADTENWIICNGTGTITVTLPAASSWTGREFTIKTRAAFTVISSASNVVPIDTGTAGTAILPATAGAWATLVSDGTNWIIMQA